MRKLLLATAALALFATSAQAVNITLGGTSDGITLHGTGTTVNAAVANGTGDGTLLNGLGSTITGNYTLGGVSFTTGPNMSELYHVVTQSNLESLSYSDSAGNSLTGSIAWSFIQDNTPSPKFFGQMAVLTSSGSAAFTGAFIPGTSGQIDWTTTSLASANPAFPTLDALVAAYGTTTVGISAGEVVPGPIVGAGIPGLLAMLGFGGFKFWRRRKA